MKKQIKFSKCNSIKNAAHTEICTREWLEAQLDSLEVLALCESVRQGHEEDKQKLPVACFHATFSDQHRHEESAVPSGLVSIDVDDHDGSLGLNPREFYLTHIEPRLKNELSKVLFVYITASGKGLRIVAERMGLATLAEEQEHLFDLACPGLSRDALDSSTKDLARASYLTTRQDVLFADFNRLFGGTVELPASTASKEESEEEEESHEGELPILPEIREEISEDHEKLGEIYYKDLVEELIQHLNKVGAKGRRNNQVYKLACDLRHVCLTPEQIESLIPHFGLTDAEFKSTIQSACKELKPNSPLPFFLSQILEKLNPAVKDTLLPPVLPTKLPKGMKEILAPYSSSHRAALAICALPALAQLACHARFDFQSSEDPDYKGDVVTFMVCLAGEPATGKSSMDKMIRRLILPIQKQDDAVLSQIQDYHDELAAEAANKKKKKNPHFDSTIVLPDTTQAAFYEMVNNAKDHPLFCVTAEIDEFNSKNSWAQNRTIFRQAFDHEKTGQRRQSTNSVTVYKPLYLNIAMSGTPDRVRQFFKNSVDGTISRIAFVQYPDDNEEVKTKDANHERRSAKNQQYISDLIERLMAEETPETPYRIPKIMDALENWCDEKDEEYKNFFRNNEALNYFRKRTHTIGIYAGAIAYILENHRESETAVNFALWAAEYILYFQLKFWGKNYNESIAAGRIEFSETANVSSNQILFLKLKAVFQESELRDLAIADGYKSFSYRKILERWRKAGFVVRLEQKGYWFQKTERGIQEADLMAQKLKTPSLTYNKPDKVA